MPSKSKSLELFPSYDAWGISILVHAFLLALATIAYWGGLNQNKNNIIDMLVVEAPKLSTTTVDLTKPIDKPKPLEQKKMVFGASRKSLTSESGIAVKAGNTVAKTPDTEVLTDEDADSLPIPVDEYAVSEMPQLQNEFRIPYPAEARKAGIQGAVVMDLLIDAAGAVREARLVQGPGFGLNEAALEAVRQFRFRPAKMAAQAVAVRIRYSYRFVLERK